MERSDRLLRWGRYAIPVVLAVAAVTEYSIEQVQATRWVTIPFALAWTLPLLAARRFPFAAPVAVFCVFATESFVEGRAIEHPISPFLTVIFSFWSMGAYNEQARAVAGGIVGLLTIGVIVTNDPGGSFSDFFFVALFSSVGWIAGAAYGTRARNVKELRERAARLERERAGEAERAVAEERARIARELHDVIAHSVSVMVVQTAGVRRLLLSDQERERQALETVEQTGRQALAEMRRLLGVLRRDGDRPALAPQPGLGTIEQLLEQVRGAGLPVELEVEGEVVQLPPGIDLTAFRIVQEALTNTLRHAGPAHAQVLVRYAFDELELRVSNDGKQDGSAEGAGYGLVGMRERVNLYGGKFEAGPLDGGGFSVSARLPLEVNR